MENKNTHLVAVYGTLKHGFGNHRLLFDSPMITDGWTDPLFRMYSQGIPYVAEVGDRGGRIYVEVYEVDDLTLRSLDNLEGHPDWYRRKQVKINPLESEEELQAWIYLMPENDVKHHKEIKDGVYLGW